MNTLKDLVISNFELLLSERKLKVIEFFEGTEMSPSTYYAMKKGKSMKLEQVELLASSLKVPVGRLFASILEPDSSLLQEPTVAYGNSKNLEICMQERDQLKDKVMQLQEQLISQMQDEKQVKAKRLSS